MEALGPSRAEISKLKIYKYVLIFSVVTKKGKKCVTKMNGKKAI